MFFSRFGKRARSRILQGTMVLASTASVCGAALTCQREASPDGITPSTRAALPNQKRGAAFEDLPPALRLAYANAVQLGGGPEYAIAAQRAHNREAELDASFVRGAITLERGGHSVNVSLAGYGCRGEARDVAEVAPVVMENRVEYPRAELTEWYLNGPLGLEQGFTIAEDPGCPAEVELDIGMTGSLSPHVTDGRIALRDTSGREVLAYGDLLVVDANGRALPADFDVHEGRVALRFDASQASFPVVVDPTFTVQQKLLADQTIADSFGTAVALDGDTAIVGASGEQNGAQYYAGAAYVFVRSGTSWTLQQKLQHNDPETASDYFGFEVDVSGDTAVIGAYQDENGGSAWVYERSGSTWSLTQKLVNPDPEVDGDLFGSDVAIDGDTLVVTAQADEGGGGEQYAGSAFVYVRSGATWTLQQKLLNTTAEVAYDWMGNAVALDGDTIAVGAFTDEPSGSVLVYTRSGSTWTLQQHIPHSDPETSGDNFASSVALSGDTLAVGSMWDEGPDGTSATAGSVWVYTRTGSTWSFQQKLQNQDVETANDAFGMSLAIEGDQLVVGGYGEENGASDAAGAAWVYTRSANTWSLAQKLQDTDPETQNDRFGSSVAISGGTIVVGAREDEANGNPVAGSVFAYVSSQPALTVSPSSFTFSTLAGTPSTQTLTLTNSGTDTLIVSTVNWGDINAAYGMGTNSCSSVTPTLAPGQSCTMNLTFNKSVAGTYNGTLSFTSNDPNPPTIINLSGTATPTSQPGISLNRSSLAFLAQLNASMTTSVTVTNTGAANLTISSASITSGATRFSVGTGTCSAPLAPNASCTIPVTFNAGTTAGSFSGTLSIVSNAPTTPTTVSLNAIGGATTTIPTLSEWGMILMGCLLAATMALAMRKKHA